VRNFLVGVATGIALVGAAAAGYGAGAADTMAAVADSAFAVSKAGQSLFRVNVNGTVGVGTIDPQARFHVTGDARADGVVESTAGGFRFPDNTQQSTAAVNTTFYRLYEFYDGGSPTGYVVDCSPGDVPTGGGFASPNTSSDDFVMRSSPTTTGWIVDPGDDTPTPSDPLFVYVICAHSGS
jgi:hypothetical protein